VPKLAINIEGITTGHCVITQENAALTFEEILSLAHGNFKEQNKVFEPSILMMNYLIIYAFV
jgi:hypothetical protein